MGGKITGTEPNNKKTAKAQWCWGAAGIVLLCSCFLALFQPSDELTQIAPYLGLSMLLAGGINVLVFHQNGKSIHGFRWMLADGMITALFSLFLLFNFSWAFGNWFPVY